VVNGKRIVIEIAPDGAVTVRAEGYAGPGCVEAVHRFSEALGLETEAENLPEFYLATDEDAGLTIGGEGAATW
jgi:hypothetical protein